MFNIATKAPPEAVTVNGGVYSIHTDFRIWIEIFDVFMFRSDDADALLECVKMAFCEPDKVMAEQNPKDVLDAMCEFLKGYPKETYDDQPDFSPKIDEDMSKERDYDFKYDLNWIVLAIRNQSGIDLSYRCEHFHWWLFLLEFESLEDHHYISALRRVRSYDGDDKEKLRVKQMYALPVRYTAEERRQLEEFNNLFYNS